VPLEDIQGQVVFPGPVDKNILSNNFYQFYYYSMEILIVVLLTIQSMQFFMIFV